MRGERFGIYCFSDGKTLFAPVRYAEETGTTLGQAMHAGAWVQKVIIDNNGTPPLSFPDVPTDFKPRILSYSKFKEMDLKQPIDWCADNIFVLLMPGFDTNDLETLQLVLEARYKDYLRVNNIAITQEEQSEDILEVKPNISGIGLNLNAAWKRFRRRT